MNGDFDWGKVGGTQTDGVWNFGWIPPALRTPTQRVAHEFAWGELAKLEFTGTTNEEPAKVDLTEIWAHPDVKAALGFEFPGVHQYTGSCVGAGLGNMGFTLAAIEVVRLKEPELIHIPFWLLPYGRSRYYAGDRRPGEGSMGSTGAKAVKEDGWVDAAHSGLPPYKLDDGLSWYADAEYSWSDGDAQQTMNLLPESRLHLVKTVAPVTNTDELEQGIRNYFPATNATDLIPNTHVEADGEAYGRVSHQGGHQTTFQGVWRHPTKGKRFFLYVNQWGLDWGKRGKCWIPDEDALAIIRDGEETYLFSQFQGFPAATFTWGY